MPSEVSQSKRSILFVMLGLIGVLPLCLSGCNILKQKKPKVRDSHVTLYGVPRFAAVIDNKKADVVLVDVRLSKAAFDEGHIEGAIHLPVDTIQPYQPFDKKTDWVCLYDSEGQGFAVVAAKRLLAGKPKYNICVLEGGLSAWKEALEGTKEPTISIDAGEVSVPAGQSAGAPVTSVPAEE